MPRVLSPTDVSGFRERICDVAVRLFASKGAQGLTMRELAGELGVSAMTPYRYFRGKGDILAAVRTRAFDRFSDLQENAWKGPGSIIERARAKCDAYLQFALSEPASYKLMFDFSQPHEDQYPDLIRAKFRARTQMTVHIRAFVEEGVLEGDPELIGLVYWSAIHGAVTLHLCKRFSPQAKHDPAFDVAQIVQEAMRSITDGFRAHKHMV